MLKKLKAATTNNGAEETKVADRSATTHASVRPRPTAMLIQQRSLVTGGRAIKRACRDRAKGTATIRSTK